jgi:hypothetical protein
VTAAQALEAVRGYAAANRYVISAHAMTRMRQRNVTPGDVHHALCNARTCRAVEDDKWRVTGPDRDGDDLDLVVAIEDGVVVVTVF